MEMKSHLLDLFAFQDIANRKIIARLGELAPADEAILLVSHLIHSQDKWLARLRQEPDANKREWFGPAFPLDTILQEWTRSVNAWTAYLQSLPAEAIEAEVIYQGLDDARWTAKLSDIALQLNFHGVHHRAQIQTLFRQQGLKPDFIDYIGNKYRRLDA